VEQKANVAVGTRSTTQGAHRVTVVFVVSGENAKRHVATT